MKRKTNKELHKEVRQLRREMIGMDDLVGDHLRDFNSQLREFKAFMDVSNKCQVEHTHRIQNHHELIFMLYERLKGKS
jgi:hypothetical protein